MEAAIAQSPGYTFEVCWRPFQLNSSMGMDKNKLKHYEEKFGKDRTKQIISRMKSVGEEHGIHFSYGGNISNTFDSHRLLWLARQKSLELQGKLVDEVFHAYFEAEQALNPDVLLAAAKKVGLEGAEEFLSNESAGAEETRREIRKYAQFCSGVPFFIFNGKYSVSGAQDPATLRSIFDRCAKM